MIDDVFKWSSEYIGVSRYSREMPLAIRSSFVVDHISPWQRKRSKMANISRLSPEFNDQPILYSQIKTMEYGI